MTQKDESGYGQSLYDELKVYYPNDPNPKRAGQGLAIAPFLFEVLGQDHTLYWLMSPAEQAAIIFLLERLRPKVAIEIGTAFGGSLQILSKFCGRVYSLDIDPGVPRRLEGKFSNVEYIIGPSHQTLPPLIDRLQRDKAELGFALVDGDHLTEGVRQDIDNLLRFTPTVPLLIIMHDSFNARCRQGLKLANWDANPYVHAVELDFVPGFVNPSPEYRGQLWSGLALAYLKPEKRQGHFEVIGRAEWTYRIARAATLHRSLARRIRREIRRLGTGVGLTLGVASGLIMRGLPQNLWVHERKKN